MLITIAPSTSSTTVLTLRVHTHAAESLTGARQERGDSAAPVTPSRVDNRWFRQYNQTMKKPREKKPAPSGSGFFFSALFALLTIAAPTFWFAQSSWKYSHILFVLWPIASALAWLYVLDGYEGEWQSTRD